MEEWHDYVDQEVLFWAGAYINQRFKYNDDIEITEVKNDKKTF